MLMAQSILYLTSLEQKLEEIASGLIERTVGPCKQAIKDSEIDLKNISDVILVGGMTRMPAVINKVKEIFGKDRFCWNKSR